MKILFAFHDIMDLGGIINFTEDLGQGFKDLGHSVELVRLSWKGRRQMGSREGYVVGKLGLPVHLMKGWIFERTFVYESGAEEWLDYAEDFDLVIWVVPVPTKSKATAGNNVWPELYGMWTPQLAIVHDGNARDYYPWLYAVAEKLTGLVCVSNVAFGCTRDIPILRRLIPNPHDMHECDVYEGAREAGFLSVQNFKGWKRVDDVIRAIPYVSDEVQKNVAGYGIEQRYMVSPTKVKPKYICNRELDPDVLKGDIGTTIWDKALASGMRWHGPISSGFRDSLLRSVTCLIDSSWSKRYSADGGIFNRTIIEAMKQGAVPIVVDLGISDNIRGDNGIFKPGRNIFVLPHGCSPKQYGGLVAEYCAAGDDLDGMRKANKRLLRKFECSHVAQQYLEFAGLAAEKTPLILPGASGYGNENNELRAKAMGVLNAHFGVAFCPRGGILAATLAYRGKQTNWRDKMPRAKRNVDTGEQKVTRARRKAKPAEDEEDEEEDEAPPVKRGRRAAKAAPAPEKATRGRRAKAAEPEDEPEEKAPRAKQERLFVESGLVWDELDDGKDTKVRLDKEAPAARGNVQTAVYEYMGEKGRRGAKASDIIGMMQEEEIGKGRESGVVSHLINVGVLEVI